MRSSVLSSVIIRCDFLKGIRRAQASENLHEKSWNYKALTSSCDDEYVACHRFASIFNVLQDFCWEASSCLHEPFIKRCDRPMLRQLCKSIDNQRFYFVRHFTNSCGIRLERGVKASPKA
jgi:hypothetical protein